MLIKDEPIRPVAARVLEEMSPTLDTPWTRRGRRPALPAFVTCVNRTYTPHIMCMASNGSDGGNARSPLAAEREHWVLVVASGNLAFPLPAGLNL